MQWKTLGTGDRSEPCLLSPWLTAAAALCVGSRPLLGQGARETREGQVAGSAHRPWDAFVLKQSHAFGGTGNSDFVAKVTAI